jgi:O-antigen ligase/tetratricopeptide (TPR) repeat protein
MIPLGAPGEGNSTWRARAGAWLLAAAIAGSALAEGTVHTSVLCVVTGALALAAGLVWWDAEPMRPRTAATLLLVAGCALTLYTAAQCVPMPLAFLAAIAPRNADVWSRMFAPLHEAGPSWAPISVDPIATRFEVMRGIAYVLAFVAALPLARRRGGIAFLSGVVLATGLVLAITALLHPAFGAKKLYGIFGSSTGDTRGAIHLAPLLNPNNLAGYINVVWCLALSGALAHEPRLPRPILAAIAAVLVATQIWVASRGGVATMVLGTALVLGIWRTEQLRRRRRTATWVLAAGALAAAATVLAVLGASDRAASELFETNTSKLQVLAEAVRMIPAYPLWGSGRGSFESAFAAFRTSPGYWTFSHPENVVAQWVTEWGIPVGVAGLVTIAIALWPSAVLVRSRTAAGAWAGIVALAAQNLVDLGTEIPGLMLAAVTCAAIVVGGTAGRESKWRVERWSRRPRGVSLAALAAGALAMLVALPCVGRTLSDDQTALHDAAMDAHAPVAAVTDLARASMRRHPAEPYFPYIAALRTGTARGGTPLPWVEATLERASIYGPVHLVLARWLAPRARAQARLEYRVAVEQAPQLRWSAMPEAARLVNGYYDAMEVVPATSPGVLSDLSSALAARLPATCARLDEELARRDPTDPWPVRRAAQSAVDDIEAGDASPWCAGTLRGACVERALALAEAESRATPTACEPHLLRARALLARGGDSAAAMRDLVSSVEEVAQRTECLAAIVELASRAHDERAVTSALDKIASGVCVDESECVSNLEYVARTEERRGNQRRALLFYKRAFNRAPDADRLLQAIAPLAAAIGMHAEAADDYDRLARKFPSDPRWASAANQQRDAAMRAAVPVIGARATSADSLDDDSKPADRP